MSGERESLFSLTDLREQASRPGRSIDGGAAFTPVRDDALLALVEAVEAAQEAWKWIDAVSRSVPDHQLAHGARVARGELSVKLLPFEESVSEYDR